MLGSGNPTPLDGYAMVVLCSLALVLLVGCMVGPRWIAGAADACRWGALLLSMAMFAAVLVITPTTTAIVGAGRLLTLYPAAAAVTLLFLGWSWRIGHL